MTSLNQNVIPAGEPGVTGAEVRKSINRTGRGGFVNSRFFFALIAGFAATALLFRGRKAY